MKKLSQLLFTILLLGTITGSSFCQRLVTGRVIDKETGKPIKEASIKLKGTNIETVVNVLGFFQLQVDSLDLITIKSPDYDSVDVRIPNANGFKIELVKSTYSSHTFENQRVYLDNWGFPSDKTSAKSYRIVNPHPYEQTKFIVKDYDLNDVAKQIGTYSDKEIYTRDGIFTLFHTNGEKSEEGFYKENSKIGKWTKWYKNGQIQEESLWDNSKDYNVRQKIENFWDSLGNKLATNGSGEYILNEEYPLSYAKGSIKNGLKSGKWNGYFKNGDLAFEEEYENNKLIKGLSYDSLGLKYKYDKEFESSMMNFYEFIGKNLRYPADARRSNVQGKVIIQILFDTDGQILKSRIVKGIGSGCDEEALRVVTKYNGNWDWGKKRGQPLKWDKPISMYLPITFKLG